MNQPKKERFKTSVGGQALMQYIIWVTDFSTRSIPVHMYGIFS